MTLKSTYKLVYVFCSTYTWSQSSLLKPSFPSTISSWRIHWPWNDLQVLDSETVSWSWWKLVFLTGSQSCGLRSPQATSLAMPFLRQSSTKHVSYALSVWHDTIRRPRPRPRRFRTARTKKPLGVESQVEPALFSIVGLFFPKKLFFQFILFVYFYFILFLISLVSLPVTLTYFSPILQHAHLGDICWRFFKFDPFSHGLFQTSDGKKSSSHGTYLHQFLQDLSRRKCTRFPRNLAPGWNLRNIPRPPWSSESVSETKRTVFERKRRKRARKKKTSTGMGRRGLWILWSGRLLGNVRKGFCKICLLDFYWGRDRHCWTIVLTQVLGSNTVN